MSFLSKLQTVDQILSTFHVMVKELETVAEHHTTQAEKHEEQIQRLQADKEDAVEEATRAMTIASNIKKLVNAVVG